MCMQYCKHGDAEEDEENTEVVGKKKRHQSEQTMRVMREGLPETEIDLAPLESHQLGLHTSERRPQQQAWTYSGDVCEHHQHPPTRSDHQRRKAILQDFRAEKQLQS